MIRVRPAAPLLALLFLLAACSGGPALPPVPPGATVLAFGDSLTFGTGVSADYSYPEVLAEITGWRVVRAGVPGEISADGLARLPDELRRIKPALVIICHGGNDVLRRMNPAETERNLRSMIQRVREHGAAVALVAVPEFGLLPSPPAFYGVIAEETGVPVEQDVMARLLRDSSMKSDRVHFNRRGYREMAIAIADMLENAGALAND